MRFLKSVYVFLLMLLQWVYTPSNAQELPLQTLSLASNNFVSTQMDGLQVDWRLDLGLTSILLNQSSSYLFSAGFLQPSINRFAIDVLERKYNPSIELRISNRGEAIVVFSKEPDLIFLDCKVYNLHGQVILSDPTKYRSSYAGRQIDINALASGIYIMQVYYLPEFLTFDNKTNYWIKSIKFIKP
jgi:hypothetical protein